ncbi:MAG: RNHCP domain-containing protein [Flavonifractor plautii]
MAVLGGPGCGKTALIQRLAGVQAPLRPTTAASLPGAGRHPLAGAPRLPGRVPRRQARPGLPPPALRGVLLLQDACARWSPQRAASQHRNHCPHCLSSLHVDEEPGDRACTCRGIMEPVGVWVRKGGEWALIHRCRACGPSAPTGSRRMTTRPSSLSIALRPLAQPPFPCPPCPGGSSREMRHNEGNDRQEADA